MKEKETNASSIRKTKRKRKIRKLTIEQKERYTRYFMQRYPCIRKIKFGENAERAITARANYKLDGRKWTFRVSAYSYESLVLAMHFILTIREVPGNP